MAQYHRDHEGNAVVRGLTRLRAPARFVAAHELRADPRRVHANFLDTVEVFDYFCMELRGSGRGTHAVEAARERFDVRAHDPELPGGRVVWLEAERRADGLEKAGAFRQSTVGGCQAFLREH